MKNSHTTLLVRGHRPWGTLRKWGVNNQAPQPPKPGFRRDADSFELFRFLGPLESYVAAPHSNLELLQLVCRDPLHTTCV